MFSNIIYIKLDPDFTFNFITANKSLNVRIKTDFELRNGAFFIL